MGRVEINYVRNVDGLMKNGWDDVMPFSPTERVISVHLLDAQIYGQKSVHNSIHRSMR